MFHQRSALGAQQVRAGEIRLENQSGFVQREIADRRQIVQVEVARTRGLDPGLRLAQFLVLQFQFDLMHLQFVEQTLRIGRQECGQVLQRHGWRIPDNLLRLLAQFFRMADGRPGPG